MKKYAKKIKKEWLPGSFGEAPTEDRGSPQTPEHHHECADDHGHDIDVYQHDDGYDQGNHCYKQMSHDNDGDAHGWQHDISRKLMLDLNVISSARVEVAQRGSLVRRLDPSHLRPWQNQ